MLMSTGCASTTQLSAECKTHTDTILQEKAKAGEDVSAEHLDAITASCEAEREMEFIHNSEMRRRI